MANRKGLLQRPRFSNPLKIYRSGVSVLLDLLQNLFLMAILVSKLVYAPQIH